MRVYQNNEDMKKLFIFMLLCLSFNRLSAQCLSSDSIASDRKDAQINKPLEKKFTILDHHIIMSLAEDYDMIYDIVSPHSFIAVRGCEYYEINWVTMEEKLLDDSSKRHLKLNIDE